MSRRSGSVKLLVVCIIVGLIVSIYTRERDAITTIVDTRIQSASGDKLKTIFDDLSPDPRMDLKRVRERSAISAQMKQCNSTSKNGRWELLWKLFGGSPVYADEACIASPCASSWYKLSDPRACVGNCTGQAWRGAIHGGYLDGDRSLGFRYPGAQACSWNPNVQPSGTCECKDETCLNGLPPCAKCDGVDPFGCVQGKRCEGGCCEDYSCPSGQSKCQLACSAGTCENGCCVPTRCTYNGDCPSDQHCSNGQCVDSLCAPGDSSCHDDTDCTGNSLCNTSIGCCYAVSPIVIDIEGNGYNLTSASHGVEFDLVGNGRRIRVAWTAFGSDDAWLALDRDGNGAIDTGLELFGNTTSQPDKPGERNGFKALAVFDRPPEGGDDDGWIDRKDAVFPRLLLWRDLNHNGISEPGELMSLPQVGITAISLDFKEAKWIDAYGNQFKYRAKVVSTRAGKGKDKWAYDVFLVAESPPGVSTASLASNQR